MDVKMTAPALTDAQRMDGYLRSLAVRRVRAEFKQQLAREGWAYLAEHWDMDAIQGARVASLLRCLHGVGKVKADRLLGLAGIDRDRTVRRCGNRQRDRLLALLAE